MFRYHQNYLNNTPAVSLLNEESGSADDSAEETSDAVPEETAGEGTSPKEASDGETSPGGTEETMAAAESVEENPAEDPSAEEASGDGSFEVSPEEEEYLNGIAMLGYDMLYGDQSVYENGLYEPTNLKMGIDPITIDDVSYEEDSKTLTVYGHNFTAYSIIVINGRQYAPSEWTESALTLTDYSGKGTAEICVAQLDNYGKAILSTTNTVSRSFGEE